MADGFNIIESGMNILSPLKRRLRNLRGWTTKRKIIVIESDDWGSIRMPSRETYQKFLRDGYPVDRNMYERYDSLASEEDLDLLFNLLLSFKDRYGNHPVFTANCMVANPDFDKIKADNYEIYHFELITSTFSKYPKHSNCFNLWKQAMIEGIFFPQYHGREHLNVSLFMEALRNRDPDVFYAFNNYLPGGLSKNPAKAGNDYLEATKYKSEKDKEEKLAIFLEGLDMFENLFGYKSKSMIAPNYIWSPDFNKSLNDKGIKYLQGIRKIAEPYMNGKSKYHCHYLGQKNNYGQKYLVRNAFFEPAFERSYKERTVRSCLLDIEAAFRMKSPAIISSHRLNYVGFIDPINRDANLCLLTELLSNALKRWPDIEFMNSVQLAELI